MLRELNGSVDFHIYGPHEDTAYWLECKRLICGLPSNVTVHDHGGVSAQNVVSVIQRHHLFVLPMRDENFGHVVLEALLEMAVDKNIRQSADTSEGSRP